MPAVAPVPLGPFWGHDDEADPLAGGLLYAFAAGTDTPRDTYADPQGLTLNPHPVVLDDAGYAHIYLHAGQPYKLRLHDQAGSLQWEVDQVYGTGGGGGSSAAGVGWGQNTVAVSPQAGTAQVAGAVFPEGVLALGLTVWVSNDLGTSQGLEQVGLGTADHPDCWGLLPALAAGTETSAGVFQDYGGQPMAGTGMVTLTAYGGRFDGTGTVYLTGHFATFRPSHLAGFLYSPAAPGDPEPPLPPLPVASELTAGIAEIASAQETSDGIDNGRIVSPLHLKEQLDPLRAKVPDGTGLSLTRYAEGGTTLEATPGLTTTSDGRLGIGVTPATGIALQVEGVTEQRAGNLRVIREGTTASAHVEVTLYSSTLTLAPGLQGSRIGNTEAVPQATPAGAPLLRLGGRVHDGTEQIAGMSAYVDLATVNLSSPTDRSTRITWHTTLTGQIAAAERLRLDGQGNLTTTGGEVATGLQAGLALKTGAAPATSPADAVQLWVADLDGSAGQAALHVRSESGVLTRLGSGILGRQLINSLTTASIASPYVATVEDSGKRLLANNSSAMVQVTLPAAQSGVILHFLLHVVQGLRIRAAPGNNIRLVGTFGSAGGAIESTTVGNYMTLLAINTTQWQTLSPVQNWAAIA